MSTGDGTVLTAAPIGAIDAESALAPSRSRDAGAIAHQLIAKGWALPALDLIALAAAFAAAAILTQAGAAVAPLSVFPVLGVLLLAGRGAYVVRLRLIVLDSLGMAAGSISVAAMSTLALGLLVHPKDPGAPLLFRAWLLGLGFVGLLRLCFILVQQRLRSTRTIARRTLIIGAGEVGARVGRRLEQMPAYGLAPIGYIDDDPPPAAAAEGLPAPVLGAMCDLVELVDAHEVEHVILAFSGTADEEVLPLLRRCATQGVGVSFVPRLFDLINTRSAFEPVGGLPVATLHSTNPLGPTFTLKHAIDRVVAALLIVVAAPLLAVIALLIKRDSRGPVLFRQRRMGRDGKVFDVLKFRTMWGNPAVQGEADAGWVAAMTGNESTPAGPSVDRTTRIGRLMRRSSLDELPQLFNVLRGDMSLVGPRPERTAYVESFSVKIARYDDRHRVKSGITGWAQVHGLRGKTSIADRVELDNYYIDNWSLWLDLKILLMTVLAITRSAE
jgi:exopolysaccharide biosynthesis polyprenyl glycosylphosphotransferase